MPALVSYWEGAILHFPLNQYKSVRPVCSKPTLVKSVREDEQEGQNLHNCVSK